MNTGGWGVFENACYYVIIRGEKIWDFNGVLKQPGNGASELQRHDEIGNSKQLALDDYGGREGRIDLGHGLGCGEALFSDCYSEQKLKLMKIVFCLWRILELKKGWHNFTKVFTPSAVLTLE